MIPGHTCFLVLLCAVGALAADCNCELTAYKSSTNCSSAPNGNVSLVGPYNECIAVPGTRGSVKFNTNCELVTMYNGRACNNTATKSALGCQQIGPSSSISITCPQRNTSLCACMLKVATAGGCPISDSSVQATAVQGGVGKCLTGIAGGGSYEFTKDCTTLSRFHNSDCSGSPTTITPGRCTTDASRVAYSLACDTDETPTPSSALKLGYSWLLVLVGAVGMIHG
eukprot:TRINITY_DN102951_c0_g1_i1.p1 TRINITY_DN102951_c0_g1~~TRINITY_DN102951_c0_g1_i1.p1  ORF type:complete len:226 (+),score=3.90 TRINITY_DN102951_c0_g1_i1:3-680(+)